MRSFYRRAFFRILVSVPCGFSLSVKVGRDFRSSVPPVFVYPSGEPWLALALRRERLLAALFAALVPTAMTTSCHACVSFLATAFDYRVGLSDCRTLGASPL